MANTKLTVNRGTTFAINGTYKENGVATSISGASIRFTVKSDEWDADADDSDAVITKSGSIVSASAGTYQITLTDTDTYITPGTYFYDIKIELANGTIYRLAFGQFVISGSPTNRTS